MVVFWLNDPSILFNVNSIKDFSPNNEMSKNKKFNAITRLLLLIIVTFYISNRCIKFLCIGVTTLAMVTLVYYINITIYLSRLELSNLHAGIVSGLKLSTLKLPNRLTITDEGLCNLQGTNYKQL